MSSKLLRLDLAAHEPPIDEGPANPALEPEMPAPKKGPSLFFLIFFGVILPAITIGVELSTRMSATSYFDPMPTTAHTLLVLSVPLINLAVALFLKDHIGVGWTWMAMAAGFSAAISAIFALAYLPLAPFSAILLVFLIGLLPAAPLFNAWAVARMSYPLAKEQPGKWLAGLALGLMLVAGVEGWARLTLAWVRDAGSLEADERASAAWKLRAFGSKSAVLEASQDRQPRLSWPWRDRSARISKQEGQRAYFLMTGEAAEAHRTQEGSDQITRFDSERGGEEVGLPVSGLDLEWSRIDGAVSSAARVAALDWTIMFRNRTTIQQEARAEVQLPPGAVVSGLSLWVNGEEQQAAFWGAKEVRQAYRQVVAARRDPLLVTWRGADRVMAQCFPVPASGEMKIKLSIAAPLDESGQVRLPQFTERNFGITKSMPLWIDVDGAVEAGPKMLRAGMAMAAEPSWTPDGSYAIRQTFIARPTAEVGRTLVVVDGSAVMAAEWPKLSTALRGMEVVIASDRVTGWDGRSTPDFAGGKDNTPALVSALRRVRGEAQSSVVWIHGAQPAESVESGLLEQALARAERTEIHSVQLGLGANMALRRIARVHSRLVTDGDWKTALESARRKDDGLVARRERVPMPAVVPTEWGKRSPPRMAALWALGEVDRLADTDRAAAIVVGWKHRVITKVTGAVVLETAADYKRAGLPQPDSAKQEAAGPPMVSTPEPGTWAMMAIGLAVIAAMRARGQW